MAEGQNPVNKMKMMRTEVSPDILQFHILPRLPAKSVGRFRCVSKEWHSFLTTLDFVKTQLLHQNKKYDDDQKLLLVFPTTPYTFRTIDCETPNKDGLSASRLLPFENAGSSRPIHMWIVASLHGLVCLRRGRFNDQAESVDMILWNPLTSDYKTLSKPTYSHDDDSYYINYEGRFGLYYSTSDDDYKLLHVTYHTNPKVYIYSLKSDSWRKVSETTHRVTNVNFLNSCVLLNEKLYFLEQKLNYRDHPSYLIMTFDTKMENWREIATPTLRKERTECMSFMVQSGSIHLCIAFTDSQGKYYHTIELWRMNGDGDWTKLITYSPIDRLSWQDKQLHIMRNGDWLMYDCFQGHVLQRDMKNLTYDIISAFKNIRISQRWKYMETLVSPNQYACDQVITPPSTLLTKHSCWA